MDNTTQTSRKRSGGCLWCLVAVVLLATLSLIPISLRPYLREPRPVTVAIADEAGMPVPNATIAVHEFEWISFIPVLTFASPSRLVERRQTVTTDSNGRAQFTVKLESASTSRILIADQALRVLSHQTTDSFRGPGERFHVPSRSDYGIEWGAVGGVSKLSYDTSIVVSVARPK